MRHRRARAGLGRDAPHRRAMVSNMLAALLEHGRIKTTQAKAQEVRRVAERTITVATRLGDILVRDRSKLSAEENARLVHASRMVRRTLRDRDAVSRVFEEWAPRYLQRSGGYTRIYKLGARRGDNAPLALIEFVREDEIEGNLSKESSAASEQSPSDP